VVVACLAIGLVALVGGVRTLRFAIRRVDTILAEELGAQVAPEKTRVDQMS
jgi:hypothetical protein